MRDVVTRLLPTVMLALAISAFMVTDRLWLHLYLPDEQKTTELSESYDRFQRDLANYLRRLDRDISDASSRADEAGAQAYNAQNDLDDLKGCVNSLQVYIYDFPYGEIDGSC